VDLHVPNAPGEDLARHVVVVLKAKAGKRVVLSGRPPKATLAATWLDVRRLIASTQAKRFSVVDALAIPRVSIRTGRSYDEIAPAPIPAIGGRLVLARQDVSLTVDERGADVDAEALLVAYGAMPRVVRFEGPFLVALLAPGRQDPYVLAWIGSPDALTAFDARVGRPPEAAQIRTLEGTWTLDPQRSLEATADHWRRISPQRKEVEDRDLVNLEAHFRTRRLRLLVRSDATVAIDTESSHKRATRVEGYLARDGARLLLIHPTVATTSEAGDERTPEDVRWTVIPGPGRLVLQAQPAGETLVLLR
jgi:hypothetical protein